MKKTILTITALVAFAAHAQPVSDAERAGRLSTGNGEAATPTRAADDLFGAPQTLATDVVGARCVRLADMDGDGDLDAVTVEMGTFDSDLDRYVGSQTAWYANDGSGGFTLQWSAATNADGASDVFPFDFKGDGDVDLLVACFGDYTYDTDSYADGELIWYRNEGGGTMSSEISISTNVDGVQSVVAADLDGDDDLDAVSASREDNKLAWFDNDGFLGFGTEAIVDTNAEFANAVAAGDLDGDDDLDLALGAYTGDEVTRFLNDGLGGFDEGLTVNSIAFGVIQVAIADFDNDGDLDVVSANQGATGVAWYPNDGGGSFGIGAGNEIAITSSTVNVEPLVVADFDQDGDPDVAVGDWGADQVTRFVNDGAGGFGEGVVVATLGGDVEGLDAGDVDGDGDLDLVACSWDDNALVWMENLGAVGVNDERGERPAAFALGEAFPNPFNPAVTIRYQIAEPAFVRLAIFDALGKHVETLVQRSRAPGSYDVRFNAANLPSGAYFYELNARAESGRTFREAKKMIYLK